MISANIGFGLAFRRLGAGRCGGGLASVARVGVAAVGDIRLEQRLDRSRESLQVIFQRRRHGIEPVHRAHEIGHRFRRSDVLDADRNDGHAGIDGALHLAADLLGAVGV